MAKDEEMTFPKYDELHFFENPIRGGALKKLRKEAELLAVMFVYESPVPDDMKLEVASVKDRQIQSVIYCGSDYEASLKKIRESIVRLCHSFVSLPMHVSDERQREIDNAEETPDRLIG